MNESSFSKSSTPFGWLDLNCCTAATMTCPLCTATQGRESTMHWLNGAFTESPPFSFQQFCVLKRQISVRMSPCERGEPGLGNSMIGMTAFDVLLECLVRVVLHFAPVVFQGLVETRGRILLLRPAS